MKRSSLTTVALASVLALLAPASSGAATSVTISATQSGTNLAVSGTTTFDDQPFVTLGTDPAGDTFAPGQDQLGVDLTAGSVRTRTNGQLVFRWSVTSLPPQTNGTPTGHAYGVAFCIDGSNCYDVDAQRMGIGAANTTGYGVLWRCADPSCTPNAQTLVRDGVPVTFDGATATITATVNANEVGATPGATLETVNASPLGSYFIWTGDATVTVLADFADGIFVEDTYSIPDKEVSLAIGEPGLDPATVTYGAPFTPAGNGSFSALLPTGGATGDKTVYARACLGSNNCGYGSVDVALT